MSRTPSGPTSRVGAWAAFVVLVGLFAMHGLASHGSMGDLGNRGDMADMGAVVDTTATVPAATVHPATHAPDDGGHGSGAMPSTGSCVVVLVLLLLLVLSLRRLGPTWLLGRARRVRLLTRGQVRLPAPPALWTLSVCRC